MISLSNTPKEKSIGIFYLQWCLFFRKGSAFLHLEHNSFRMENFRLLMISLLFNLKPISNWSYLKTKWIFYGLRLKLMCWPLLAMLGKDASLASMRPTYLTLNIIYYSFPKYKHWQPMYLNLLTSTLSKRSQLEI